MIFALIEMFSVKVFGKHDCPFQCRDWKEMLYGNCFFRTEICETRKGIDATRYVNLFYVLPLFCFDLGFNFLINKKLYRNNCSIWSNSWKLFCGMFVKCTNSTWEHDGSLQVKDNGNTTALWWPWTLQRLSCSKKD